MACRLRAQDGHGRWWRQRWRQWPTWRQRERLTKSSPEPWTLDGPPRPCFDFRCLERPVPEVARALLGCRLRSTVGGAVATVVIVEAEAYGGPEDPASHAATVRGVTERNRTMFGSAGSAYVYRSYGIHSCVNVVTGPEGVGQAVLLRGGTPIEGLDVMARRRGREPLASGPGRLCEALAVDLTLNGHDLRRAPLELLGGWDVPDERVGVSGRVGLSVATRRPYRFYVRGASGVSRPDGWTPLSTPRTTR